MEYLVIWLMTYTKFIAVYEGDKFIYNTHLATFFSEGDCLKNIGAFVEIGLQEEKLVCSPIRLLSVKGEE